MTVRDLPLQEGSWERPLWRKAGDRENPTGDPEMLDYVGRDLYNLDYAWFHREEAARWVPPRAEVGAAHRVPQPLVERLARFHLLNNVRCHTALCYEPEDVRQAELTATVEAVSGGTIRLHFEGATLAEMGVEVMDANLSAMRRLPINLSGQQPEDGRAVGRIGYAGRLLGRAIWETDRARFTAFEMVSVGTRWGHESTRRLPDEAVTPLGFAFQLAGDSLPDRAAPDAVRKGAHYWDPEGEGRANDPAAAP
jgi:hypothetical protein